jgi:hypothetical protein
MAGTARTAGALGEILGALSAGQRSPVDLGVDVRTLAGRPSREVMEIITNAIRPTDGTQDTEAAREALAAARSDLVAGDADTDLTALRLEQIEFLIERYVAHDLCRRIELDIGKAILIKAPDPATAVRRMEEMKQYVIEEVAARSRARRDRGELVERGRYAALASGVIRDTLAVFEEYIL